MENDHKWCKICTVGLDKNYRLLMDILPDSLILIAVMNNPRDMEIARLLGWYRIPLRSAPKVVAVDFLAFYQTNSFGDDHGGCVEWAAAVRGHELTTRAELLRDEPDHPHANHTYYKIQLGALGRLPHPILADKWRRLTFLYTTGEYLLRAETFQELVVRSDERHLLWQTLRERANESQSYQAQPDLPALDLDPVSLAVLLGIRDQQGTYNFDKYEGGVSVKIIGRKSSLHNP